MALVVNGEAIDDTEIREEARSLRPRYFEMMQGADPIAAEIQLREWSRENIIERVLLRQEAARRGVTLEVLIDQVASKISTIRYRDVGEFYRKHKETLWVPEVLHAAHIVKNIDENNTEEQALAAIRAAEAELKAGADFAELADRVSDCPGNGGDLGWFPSGQMVAEFDEVVFKLGAGETSGIFRTMFGFHIARVLARKAAGIPGLMDVRDQIEGMMRKEKQQKALEQFVDALKAQAAIAG
jgi:parvulin-like peptidyl-prolyl isomerase